MTLGVAAADQVRLIVWCKACQHQDEPRPPRRYPISAPALQLYGPPAANRSLAATNSAPKAAETLGSFRARNKTPWGRLKLRSTR